MEFKTDVRLWGDMMESREQLRAKLHELEKRLDNLEVGLGGLMEMLISRGQLSLDFNRPLQSWQERIAQYAEEELDKLRESLLDEELASVDEREMPHA
ncbi:MAG: hypothetical protein ACE5G5_08195 [Candidatus Methylomirabilales bacterium]